VCDPGAGGFGDHELQLRILSGRLPGFVGCFTVAWVGQWNSYSGTGQISAITLRAYRAVLRSDLERPSMSSAIRLLRGVIIAGEALLLGWLLATEDLSGVGFLALGVLGAVFVTAIALINWPFGALLLLSAASAMPRLAESVLGLHLRPEHIATSFVALLVCCQALNERKRPSLRLRAFDYFLIAYVGLNFFTSAVTSPEPRMTLRWATLNAIVVSPYFLVRFLIKDKIRLHRAFHILLWVGAAESAYGILCFVSHLLFQTSFGVEVGQYGAIPGTYGTQYEANLFGSYTACCAIMFLAYFLLSQESRRFWYGLGLAVTTIGALISLARSVFLAFPVAALLVVWIALKKGEFQIRRLAPLLLGVGLLVGAFSPLVWNMVRERFSTIDFSEISTDNTTWERAIQMSVAIEDVQARPMLGTGTASFHLFFDPNDYPVGFAGDEEEAGWISNTPLRILHDTGVTGLMVFVLFVGFLGVAVRNAARGAAATNAAILTALSVGGVLYAITFQATEATMLAFTWVHLGLLATAVTILQQKKPLSQEANDIG
jgi:O-antigen ligase